MKLKKNTRILITGGSGLVGTALIAYLKRRGFLNIFYPKSSDYNLISPIETANLFLELKPEVVFHLAGFVKGIMGNKKRKGESFYKNMMINTNTVHSANEFNCKKFLGMGSGCVYPYPSNKKVLDESLIWMGSPHESEDSYAHAKRAMLAHLISYNEQYKMNYCFVISPNLFGANDLFDSIEGHVIPSLIKKFHQASLDNSSVEVWGDGSAQRDFLFSKDVAEGLLLIMENIQGPVNLGSGNVHSIKEVVNQIKNIFGFEEDRIIWNKKMPNGQDHRSYNLDKLNEIGFKPSYTMANALKETINWYIQNYKSAR
jgi:GDP-L-fucose synthase